ncbi:MAG: UvrABC system protein A [Isosphaeraceae bacterium]|jgi:excinuclease ABC subunit A|nr:MAG: UvrABC system protein A [Isosphaeraceae bacterium]
MSDPNGGWIRVRGARVHNLRDLDVGIPRDRLVALTGVSGSGKSTLAFDTLYAEAQRRFLETLSNYARQHLEQLEPPDVDAIEGLPPTVAIDQRWGGGGPRSTVATITEIHDHLRLLYARLGTPHCPGCGRPIRSQTPEQMVEGVLALPEGRRVMILAPLVRGRKGEHAEAFGAIRRAGLIRARVDGEIVEVVDRPPTLARTKMHTIEAVVDRLVVRDGIRHRLAESVQRAVQIGEGTVVLAIQEGEQWQDRVQSTRLSCPECGIGLEAIEPRMFSFNSPYGACRSCDGLGVVETFDADLVLPDRARSLDEGAVAAWSLLGGAAARHQPRDVALRALLKRAKVNWTTPLEQWPPRLVEAFLHGDPDAPEWSVGLLGQLEAAWQEARTDRQRESLAAFRSARTCLDCGGERLRAEARGVRLAGCRLPEVLAWPLPRARAFFEQLTWEPAEAPIGRPLVAEVVRRLDFLLDVGLGYLTLDRRAETLSGGELQRVRLATQVGSGLVGVCYVLDEPTTGLHPRDTDRLLDTLEALRRQGNTVLVVEHDERVVGRADWVIDLGPGAGPDGGQIVAEGSPEALDPAVSLTARYLRNGQPIEGLPARPARLRKSPGSIWVRGAAENNLKRIDARFPLGTLIGVTGVSGSGKSSLVMEVLARGTRRALERAGPRPGAHTAIEGLEAIDRLIVIDQTPIGRTPRSTAATYTGVYDEIRKVFATTREAKLRGFRPNRFSFNVKGGRCEACQGQGQRKIEMQFLPDLFIACEICGGKRFNAATLEVTYKGRSIADVLEMRVDEALAFFDAIPKVQRGLEALHEAGLGYLSLGQSSTTLSGGEAQRVKLAAELGRPAGGRTLYILDEPTSGLHPADVANLVRVLGRLADAGNTVVVIEHNLQLIRQTDWIIDLGPEGGDGGGRVVVMGPPRKVADCAASWTGRYLASG